MVQTKADRERQKLITDKCQALIEVLLKDEDNKYCVDCDAKGPRWASWNLGIFLCIRCAGIHRNLGVHISRVKSVNLDAWTPEHVAYVQRMGNSRARAIYEANLPNDFRRPQTDTALESFIRAKYEHKRYIDGDYVDPGPPEPAFDAEEELKRMKEQKKSRLNSGNHKTMISVSDSFTPASSANVNEQATNISKSRSSSSSSSSQPQQPHHQQQQQKQQQPSLLFGSECLGSGATVRPGAANASAQANSKPKSNLADLMDLDLGFGSSNLLSSNTFCPTTNSAGFNTASPAAALNTPNISSIGSLGNISTNTGTTATSNPTSNNSNNNNNIFGNSFNLDATVPRATGANHSVTSNTGKNVFDLLDI